MRLAEFRVGRERFAERVLGFVEFLFLHENFAAQIVGGGLVGRAFISQIEKFEGRREIALLESALGPLEIRLRIGFHPLGPLWPWK